MSGCYCETVYDGYCGYCFDTMERERDEAREALKRGEETAARMLDLTIQERDEARECLREIISQLTLVDARPSGETWQLATCDGDEVQRWRKAAGLDHIVDANKKENEE